MQAKIQELTTQAAEALNAWRGVVDKYRDKPDEAMSGEDAEKAEKAKAQHKQLSEELSKLKARQAEIDEVDHLHEQYTRATSTMGRTGPVQPERGEKLSKERYNEAHSKVFNAWLRSGNDAARETWSSLGPQEQHALNSVVGNLGQFTVPEDFQTEVIENLASMAVARRICRVQPTSRDTLVWVTVAQAASNGSIWPSGFSGDFKSQTETVTTRGDSLTTQNQPTFGQKRIPVYKWQPDVIELSFELVEDTAVDLDSLLARTIAQTKALDEDRHFFTTTGTGSALPLGILQASDDGDISTVASGSASALTYGGLVDLMTNLPAQYSQNATFLMSHTTYGAILKLEDTAGNPIIPPNSMPGTLWGKRVEFSDWMPSVTNNTEPIIFGDFSHYVIAERMSLEIRRLTENYAPNVGILPIARVGGGPTLYDAFRVQTVST